MIRQKTFEEIYQSIRNNINDRDDRIDSKPGTFVSDVFVCPQADELAAYYADLKIMEINQSVLLATESNLDKLAHNYFITREGAKTATGTIRFYIENTNKATINKNNLPSSIYIPSGFIVSTTEDSINDAVEFTVDKSVYISQDGILALPIDPSIGYKYLETTITAVNAGDSGNVDSYSINTMISNKVDGILACNNPTATTGGQDEELDESLRFRILLAVLGASICTKNGYLKYIIQQSYVEDALVIGGGDELMYRDGGYINAANSYQYGRGGMVDIWVRGARALELTTQYKITSTYLEKGAGDIILDYQPVMDILYIKSVTSDYVYENAANYDIEYGIDAAGNTTTKYYRDILWDFTVTDNFPDLDYYDLDVTDQTEIELLKQQLDEELTNAIEYMSNISYSINWSLTQLEDISSMEIQPVFQKVYYNSTALSQDDYDSVNDGKIFKLITVDNRLNGRTFVMKDNKIYLRWYATPDYVLVKTAYSDEKYESLLGEDIGNSVLASDAIHWLQPDKLIESDTLIISYNYNLLINNLQTGINNIRILTADILVRQAFEVPIQIQMSATCDVTVSTVTTRNLISTAISTFINNFKTMGGSIEESELASIARQIPGVTSVDLDTVAIAKKNMKGTKSIALEPNEYFSIANIDITVTADES